MTEYSFFRKITSNLIAKKENKIGIRKKGSGLIEVIFTRRFSSLFPDVSPAHHKQTTDSTTDEYIFDCHCYSREECAEKCGRVDEQEDAT